MSHYDNRSAKPAGSSPGTVVYIGEERTEPVTVSFIRFDPNGADAPRMVAAREVKPPTNGEGILWYTIDGVHDAAILNAIGERFGLHGLVLEDIANTKQRPKIEEFENYIFVS